MIGSGHFAPTPIRSPAGHALSYEETEQRLASVLERVPVTRVYDATPLDWLGLPVWAAVTPLAIDLTVHAGKGRTSAAARISAVMEAIERVCAETVPDRRIRTATFTQLRRGGAEALDPELFDLPFGTGYRPDRPLAWTRGYDLIAERDAWVPLDLVVSPAREGICSGVETNGLAAGNNHTEAALHALHELVERDALAHSRFARLYADGGKLPALRIIDRATLPAAAAEWVARLHDRGLRIVIQDVTHDLEVPVFRATIYDRSFPGREGRTMTFEGMGADLDPAWAASRAVCEAVQSHTVMVVGARDSVEDGGRHVRLDKRSFLRRMATPSSMEPFPAAKGHLPDDLGARLRILSDRVAAAGLRHAVVVDLTREDLGIPVVRVLVPGLAGPFGDTSRRPTLRLLRTLVPSADAAGGGAGPQRPRPRTGPTAGGQLRATPPAPLRKSPEDPPGPREFAARRTPNGVGPQRPRPRTGPAAGGQLRATPPAPLRKSPEDPPGPREFAARRTPNGVGPHPFGGGHHEPVGGGQLRVFSGPSLDPGAVAAALPAARVEPPIARGDLARHLAEGTRAFLILDGVFAHRLAVSPSEIVDAIADGARIIGAASMGAIRAAECRPAGMEGVGAVYRLYRLGLLRDDDEVAVATDPDREFAAISVALVSVRYAALAGLRAGLLGRAQAAAVLTTARQTHFLDRQWRTIFSDAGVELTTDLRTLCDRTDVKRRDASAAVGRVAREIGATGRVRTREHFRGGRRRSHHRTQQADPLFGHSLPTLQRELASWLVESGRYSRYFDGASPRGSDSRAAAVSIWEKLAAGGALDGELMHWHAIQRLAAYS